MTEEAHPRKKAGPQSIARGNQASPRGLRPVSETWGAAPMPPPEPSRRRAIATMAVGGASLATAAALALFMTRTTCSTNLNHSSDDWMSVVKRQVLPMSDVRAPGEMPIAMPVGGAPPPVVERSDPAHSSLRVVPVQPKRDVAPTNLK